MSFKSTIIIPSFTHPNFLETTVEALVRNSFYKHKIMIVGSDPVKVDGRNAADDFKVNQNFERYQKYKSVNEFLNNRENWLKKNNVVYVDTTDAAKKLRVEYAKGNVYGGKTFMENGVDIAFKNNIGLELVTTDFVMPNWDDDFYPGWHWDKPLFDYADLFTEDDKFVFVPTHVQPYLMRQYPKWENAWTDARYEAPNRLVLPLVRRDQVLYESEFFSYCDAMRRDDAIVETCGKSAIIAKDDGTTKSLFTESIIMKPDGTTEFLAARDSYSQVHYLPIMYRTNQIRTVGCYSYIGTGYDLEMDVQMGRNGFFKISPRSSFIMHKGWVVEQ